jgi:Tfp pilus assembly protein PilN
MKKPKPTVHPTGLCIDERNAQIIIADYAPDGGFDIHRALLDEPRTVNITSADLRTIVDNANAHTQATPAPVSASDSDEAIITSLLDPARDTSGLISNFTRTPDGRILLTQAEERSVATTTRVIEQWLTIQQPTHFDRLPHRLRVETRTRAIARVWHHTSQAPEFETVAFLVLSNDDYAVGLWSKQTGLVYETEESFEAGATAQIKCKHSRNMFARLIAAGTIENLHLSPVTKAIVSAPEDLQDQLLALLTTSDDLPDVEVFPIYLNEGDQTPLDQPSALAIGALLDDPELPPCDLNITLQEQIEVIKERSEEQERVSTQARAMYATLAVLIPIVAVLAVMIASYIDRVVERNRLQSRLDAESTIAQNLAKENADYESSKASFATFQNLLDNLIGLRQRQPASFQLLRDLDQRWPRDNSWLVSEMNVKGGNVEIKGKTRNEQAITSFAKSLEFSDGLFTNILTKNNLQGATSNPSAPLAATSAPSSNVVEFTVSATYTPLASPGKQLAPSSQSPAPVALPAPPAIPLITPTPLPSPNSMLRTPPTNPTPLNGVNQ